MRSVIAMIDKNKMNDLLNGTGVDENTKNQINDFVKNLSDKDVEKLNKILGDKNATDQLLKSPQAQELLKKFGNKDK